ncbi:MAG TPA: hypothetical protein VE224_18910 [Pseudolabrys sp.]|jgi:hypothetical protein|nr:hypothetical protein [Pseudolabrys sp.]
MNAASIAAALTGAQASSAHMALAAQMLRMNADSAGMVAKIVEAAQENLKSLANVANGVGKNVNLVA